MKYLLDNDLLTGPHEVQTRLRPWRYARLIVGQDGAFALASHLCQVWGGASNPIIPLVDHVSPIPDDIVSDLTRAEIDGYVVPAGGSDPSPPHLERAGERDFPAAIIVAQTPRSTSRTLQVVDLEDGDPWKPIYLATLGMVADRVDDALLATLNVQSFLLDDIIPVEHIRIKGSLEDLLGRLSDPETITPRQFSTLQLASGANPHTGYMGSAPLIQPAISMRHTAAGPNVAVVFTPGSVDDFALLWNLRCFWGDQRALPIGLPREEINDGTFDKIYQYAGMFGFGGGHLHLVSESLSIDDLETFRRTAPPVEVATRSELPTVRAGSFPLREPDAGLERRQSAAAAADRGRSSALQRPVSASDTTTLGSRRGCPRPASGYSPWSHLGPELLLRQRPNTDDMDASEQYRQRILAKQLVKPGSSVAG